MESLFALLEALQNAWLPTALRLSSLAYPLVNAAHIIGLALLFGSIVALDLRLLGFWRSVPLQPLSRLLRSVAIVGLGAAIISGSLLFSVHAVKYAGMGVFQLKLGLVVAGIANALLLHRSGVRRSGLAGSSESAPPARLRAAAALSLLLWVSVVICGRMIAYYA